MNLISVPRKGSNIQNMMLLNILLTACTNKQFLSLAFFSVSPLLHLKYGYEFGKTARYDSDDVLHIEDSRNYMVKPFTTTSVGYAFVWIANWQAGILECCIGWLLGCLFYHFKVYIVRCDLIMTMCMLMHRNHIWIHTRAHTQSQMGTNEKALFGQYMEHKCINKMKRDVNEKVWQ